MEGFPGLFGIAHADVEPSTHTSVFTIARGGCLRPGCPWPCVGFQAQKASLRLPWELVSDTVSARAHLEPSGGQQ